MKIAIRADSGIIMGSGHIMRCLTLADELKAETIFYCRNLPGNIKDVIETRGYKVVLLSDNLQKADIEFLECLKQKELQTLIIDSYETNINLESKAREYVDNIVVIDDIANRRHDCDILLDQNPCPATHARYKNLIPQNSIKLLGLGYALLGKEFSRHCDNNSAPHNNIIKNILIFFGGGDHKNLTQKVIEILISCPNNTKDIKFNVIVGASNQNKDRIQSLCETNPNFTFHCQVNNMDAMMREADLFIGAGGTTNWERMCIGLPAVLISIAENQEESCRELTKFDVVKYLGTAEDFSGEKLLDTIKWVIENPQWIHNASINGQRMVDGKGAKRVTAIINSLSINFTKATIDDCENIFNWRNAEENRQYSINTDKIEFEVHAKWFSRIITDKNHDLLIASKENISIAVMRFDYDDESAEISLYMTPGNHGKGLGLPLLLAAELWLKHNRQDIAEINAKVLLANLASVKIFQHALYKTTNSDKNIAIFNKGLK